MLNSTVLEVAVGLVFCYATMSLIASSVYEAIASLFKLRARSLLQGVKSLLNDPKFTGLARDIYNHALVNPRDAGNAPPGQPPRIKPSYIKPRAFAIALTESIQGAPATSAELKAQIDKLPEGQIKSMLLGMYARAEGKLEDLQSALAGWFDAGMDRVSGAYKRQAQLFTFIIAVVIAGLFNVDSFHLFKTLWAHPAYAARIAAGGASSQDALAAVTALDSLPIGWTTDPASIPLAVGGWITTALTVLFGAPFWFDTLQRLVNLRGAGDKPAPAKETNKTP
jgi:hypothetical protein